jgi:hypothetical protein
MPRREASLDYSSNLPGSEIIKIVQEMSRNWLTRAQQPKSTLGLSCRRILALLILLPRPFRPIGSGSMTC